VDYLTRFKGIFKTVVLNVWVARVVTRPPLAASALRKGYKL